MSPAPWLLDLTRLQSRAGRARTGIDRVERAWLAAALDRPGPVFGLLRSALGVLLLDRAGMARFAAAHDADAWGGIDRLSWLARRLDPARAAAESLSRSLSVARAPRALLGPMLRRHVPPGALYLNVGHAHLEPATLRAVRRAGLRVVVLVHDTLPLDLPWAARPGTPAPFDAKLRAVARHADRVIVTARATARDVERHLARHGRVPDIAVAPLGVSVARPDPAALPPGLDLSAPYMVALGTIEPRKNHALLLDVWAALGPAAPRLYICGARGWNNDAVFARLDAGVAGVTELPGLSDGAVAALLAGARALVFPSLAEGYGLPPLEAAAMGVPVLCADLPVCRELLGDAAVYLDPRDRYGWEAALRAAATRPPAQPGLAPPGWARHVALALAGLDAAGAEAAVEETGVNTGEGTGCSRGRDTG
ncbi:glycosyltransferase family 4 protein [Limimaricola pyoseonensis]|uniref:Glycosyl transferases group 1 n=1 Tax=Limimaricola pyoseonensis TaxID=521013 RepID=A0A1G7ETB2_9RHOB|nr:glycosyltransferase family 1 protein [Limimaricola pyoseonensis]SDE66869.1 Glycosyl transferases group 1 [Limimaricola pyoseonensis]